jgi:hypothetical protein
MLRDLARWIFVKIEGPVPALFANHMRISRDHEQSVGLSAGLRIGY